LRGPAARPALRDPGFSCDSTVAWPNGPLPRTGSGGTACHPPQSPRVALRALDGRLDQASYRDIAEALFGTGHMPERGWKTHDLRDRTIRLARLGQAMMQGGYRRLLLYPFRGQL